MIFKPRMQIKPRKLRKYKKLEILPLQTAPEVIRWHKIKRILVLISAGLTLIGTALFGVHKLNNYNPSADKAKIAIAADRLFNLLTTTDSKIRRRIAFYNLNEEVEEYVDNVNNTYSAIHSSSKSTRLFLVEKVSFCEQCLKKIVKESKDPDVTRRAMRLLEGF